jgi:hypothetical protein
MEKRITALLGAVAALSTMGAAQASPAPAPSPSDALKANSYADLLEPIPDAAKVLQVLDEQAPTTSADRGNVQLAQGYYHHHHHHQVGLRSARLCGAAPSLVSSSQPSSPPSPPWVL